MLKTCAIKNPERVFYPEVVPLQISTNTVLASKTAEHSPAFRSAGLARVAGLGSASPRMWSISSFVFVLHITTIGAP